MMINDNILKCNGQYPKLIHMLVMLTKLLRHISFLIIALRCFQDNLSSPRINKSLYLAIALLNFSVKKEFQVIVCLAEISSNKSGLI